MSTKNPATVRWQMESIARQRERVLLRDLAEAEAASPSAAILSRAKIEPFEKTGRGTRGETRLLSAAAGQN